MKMLLRVLGLLLTGLLLLPGLALADATPVQLVLLYMPNISNTGTTTASGIAELVMPEGEVRITAANLPRLENDAQYVAWVVSSATNQFQRIGTFNSAQSTDAVHYENVLPDAIPDNHWNLLLVTIEDSANADHPSTNHSIAGVFPSADNQPLPGVLPNTGGDVPVASGQWPLVGWVSEADRPPLMGLLALMFSLGLAAGYGVRKRREAVTSGS